MSDHLPIIGSRFRFPLTMTRIINDFMLASKLNFAISYVLSDDHDMEDIIAAWNRVEEWLSETAQCIVMCSDNSSAMAAMFDQEENELRFSNPIMLLPTEPGEDALGFVIQAKFNALADNAISFEHMTISQDEANGIELEIIGNGRMLLPSLDEWMGEGTYFKVPWWNRNDSSTLDTPASLTNNPECKPEWSDEYTYLEHKPSPSGAIIQGRFKPKIVED